MTGFYSAFIVAERRKEARELWENKFRKNAEKVYDLILEKYYKKRGSYQTR